MAGEASAPVKRGWLYHPEYPDHWERRSLYSMAEWVNGLAFRDTQLSAAGMPVIKIAEIKGGISEQTKFTEQTFDDSVRVRAGDLLFSWSGQPETSIDAFWWRGPEGWLNQHVFRVTPNEAIDPTFFYYLLRYLNPNFVGIARNKQTTGLGHVTKRDLENIEAAYPDLPEQRAISRILGSLDDKIELNRRMNETLEDISRAIFKSWFIDLDPVLDNALKAGNPIPDSLGERAARRRRLLDNTDADGRRSLGLRGGLSALFPDRFEQSGLGATPRGWNSLPVGDVCDFVYGKGLRATDRAPGTVPVYGSNGQVGWHDQALVAGPGIVIGRKGNPGTVVWVAEDFWPIDTTFFIAPKGPIESHLYLYHSLRLMDLPSLTADTAVPGLNRNIAYMSPIRVPSEGAVLAFDKLCIPFYQKIRRNDGEIRTLGHIRDAILPQLLSGETRIV